MFYLDVADEEGWIKEKKQLMSSQDLGYDVTSVHVLLNKQKQLEDEMTARRTHLKSVLQVGNNLITAGNFGVDRIQSRIDDINQQWDSLIDLAAHRNKRLNEAVNFYQFFAAADDVDVWMLDTLRLVSSEDVGKDEASVQSILKKHKDVTEELENYKSTIEQLHGQAANLGEQDRELPVVQKRLNTIDNRYEGLKDFAKLREQRLLDALSLYKLFNESDSIKTWIDEKEIFLTTFTVTDDIEELAIMKHRFDSLEHEMNSTASKVAAVNQLAGQLLQEEHPNAAEVMSRQNELNGTWYNFRDLVDRKREEINVNLTHGLQNVHIECNETIMNLGDPKQGEVLLYQQENLSKEVPVQITQTDEKKEQINSAQEKPSTEGHSAKRDDETTDEKKQLINSAQETQSTGDCLTKRDDETFSDTESIHLQNRKVQFDVDSQRIESSTEMRNNRSSDSEKKSRCCSLL